MVAICPKLPQLRIWTNFNSSTSSPHIIMWKSLQMVYLFPESYHIQDWNLASRRSTHAVGTLTILSRMYHRKILSLTNWLKDFSVLGWRATLECSTSVIECIKQSSKFVKQIFFVSYGFLRPSLGRRWWSDEKAKNRHWFGNESTFAFVTADSRWQWCMMTAWCSLKTQFESQHRSTVVLNLTKVAVK